MTGDLEAVMIRLKTILVPTDFSECSDAAIRYGAALAEAFGASLQLLSVVHDPYSRPWAAEGFAAPIADLMADWEAEARRRLAECIPPGAESRTTLVTAVGAPQAEIVRYAAEHDVDLIVLGTHGRGPIGHLLLGSVAERVVRSAPCPVLTVRHPQHEFVTEVPATEQRSAAPAPSGR